MLRNEKEMSWCFKSMLELQYCGFNNTEYNHVSVFFSLDLLTFTKKSPEKLTMD